MISQVLMDNELGKLVFSLMPEKTSMVITQRDKYFQEVLEMLYRNQDAPKTQENFVSLKIEIRYKCVGIDTCPKGHFFAIFEPDFGIFKSDLKWGVVFDYDDQCGKRLGEIAKIKIVKKDIPDIEETKTWVHTIFGGLEASKPIWVIKK